MGTLSRLSEGFVQFVLTELMVLYREQKWLVHLSRFRVFESFALLSCYIAAVLDTEIMLHSRHIVITVISWWQHVTFYSELFASSDSELCISMATLSTPKQILRRSRGTSRSSQKTPSSQVVITRTWTLFTSWNLVITGIPIWRERTLKSTWAPAFRGGPPR